MAPIEVIFRHEGGGGWTATVPTLKTCQAQGRSLEQTRARVRQVIAACEGVPLERVKLEEVHFVAGFDRALERVRRKRARAELAARSSANDTRDLAIRLVCSMTVRDAAELLGLSHGRVQQLVE